MNSASIIPGVRPMESVVLLSVAASRCLLTLLSVTRPSTTLACLSKCAVEMDLTLTGVSGVCRENLSQWEKIALGEVEDVIPSRPADSGPVKVDN